METILEVKNLNITFQDMIGELKAVNDLSFAIRKGEILSLIGESGSGKSVTAKAIMRLLEGGKTSGSILFHGKDLFRMKEKEVCRLRGTKISMIFQEPMTALNPVVKVGTQLEEVFRIHKIGTKDQNHRKMIETLKVLNISHPEELLEKYPFELSGGLRQRIVIAMAVICEPELIIADEPTTALDVTTQMETLLLLKKVASQIGSAVLLITHDLGVVAECADRVIVMYRGRKMEECEVNEFFLHAEHPYSRGLIASRPSNFNGRYHTISGNVEQNYGEMKGCPYRNRCESCTEKCKSEFPGKRLIAENHTVSCWNID
ncbi:MAG: ABC transporter ATP-binding protein [Dorea sp.]|nr:ABC transporter ATP-binding protein [Dorea sp.]